MKQNLKPHVLMYPAPAVVVSAFDENKKADACTLAFATMCSHHPPAMMIAINSTLKRKTLQSILLKKCFSMAFPSCEHLAEIDYLGIESGYREDKLKKINFTYKEAEYINAPIINEFKVSLECKVINTVDIGSHTQITGEIVNIQADEEVLDSKGKISVSKLNPIAYDDYTHAYYSVGDKLSDAFKIGLKFRK